MPLHQRNIRDVMQTFSFFSFVFLFLDFIEHRFVCISLTNFEMANEEDGLFATNEYAIFLEQVSVVFPLLLFPFLLN